MNINVTLSEGVSSGTVSYGYYDKDGKPVELGNGIIGKEGLTIKQVYNTEGKGNGSLYVNLSDGVSATIGTTTIAKKGTVSLSNMTNYGNESPQVEDVQKIISDKKAKE